MNNTETLTTSDTQDTGQNKHQSKQKGQSRMNNTETLTTSDTQDTDKINTRVNRRDNQNEQHRDTDNIGYTRHRQNKHQSKQKGQSRMNNTETLVTSDTQDTGQNNHQSKQKEQHRDTDNIGYTRHRTK